MFFKSSSGELKALLKLGRPSQCSGCGSGSVSVKASRIRIWIRLEIRILLSEMLIRIWKSKWSYRKKKSSGFSCFSRALLEN
jgi:hypothetical protein